MTCRLGRPRFSVAPILLVLTVPGAAFLLGVFTSSFLTEFLQLNTPTVVKPTSPSAPSAPSIHSIPSNPSNRSIPSNPSNRSIPSNPSNRSIPSNPSTILDEFTSFTLNCSAVPVASESVKSLLVTKIFDGESPFSGFPSNETAALLRRKRIKGWGSTNPVFERLLREVRPKVVLELGTFLGASAIHMGELARNMSLECVILCVDDFRGWPGFREKNFMDIKMLHGNNMLYYQFMKNVLTMNLTNVIVPIPFSTSSALQALCEWGVRADLIEVDAAHDFHSAWLDLNFASYVLRPGGVMFGHDYYLKAGRQGVRRAVDTYAKLNGLFVETDGKHWILRNKSRDGVQGSVL